MTDNDELNIELITAVKSFIGQAAGVIVILIFCPHWHYKQEFLDLENFFHPSIIFKSKAGAYPSGATFSTHSLVLF
jgi:hypothetical protein